MDHDPVDSSINVSFNLVQGLADMSSNPFVIKLISSQLMVLKLLHSLAQAVNLPRLLFLVQIHVFLNVQHSFTDLFGLFLHLCECL